MRLARVEKMGGTEKLGGDVVMEKRGLRTKGTCGMARRFGIARKRKRWIDYLRGLPSARACRG